MLSLSFLAYTAIAATISALSLIAIQIIHRKQQIRWLSKNGLKPNVLLTRHPLVFINRRRRLHRLFGDFSVVPMALREHGFEVNEIVLDATDSFSSNLSLNELEHAISQLKRPAHLFIHPSLNAPRSLNPNVISVTPLRSHSVEQALVRAVSLAERDLQ